MVETENLLGFVADTFDPTLNLREAVPIMNPQRNTVLLEYNRILLTIQRNSRWLTNWKSHSFFGPSKVLHILRCELGL
jgi:hypothetical protein